LWGLVGLLWLWNIFSAVRFAEGRPSPAAPLIITLVLFSYLMGWFVTEINMEKLVTKFPRTFQIFSEIAWPWKEGVAFRREEESLSAEAPFGIPCGTDAENPKRVR